MSIKKKVVILGTRGIPAKHGGFETFAEYLSLYLKGNEWEVLVYCQENGSGRIYESEWRGIKLIHVPVHGDGPKSTILFDFRSVWDSLKYDGIYLTLGYNTAVFNLLHRLKKNPNLINMDGIEWKRQKWGVVAKLWFWVNERLGCWFGKHLVADHPEIANHLATRVSRDKITMIPYGAPEIENPDDKYLEEYGLKKNRYAILIARAEPENSILEVVKAFSMQDRNLKLVILGNYLPENNEYHQMVKEAASEEVVFLGAIYKSEVVHALRYFARVYIHGHQVGGTNPSLVEAIGAGNAIIAHDNVFNRWVAKDGAQYFDSLESLSNIFKNLLDDGESLKSLQRNSNKNFSENFRWKYILREYENLLLELLR